MEIFTEEELEESWRWNLDDYAERVSEGYWKPYDWHVYLANILVQAVLEGNQRLIITAPPRHGKSELTSRWLSTWFLDTFPEKRVILASYAASLSEKWSMQVRDTFDGSNRHVNTRLNPKKTSVKEWYTEQGGGMKAVGTEGSIVGFGGDLVLIDDPHKDWAEVQKSGQRQKKIDWFNGTLYHRLEPNATIILIQTRWNEGDLAGYLLNEHNDDWTEIRMPALAEENDVLGRKKGEALCPERYDVERLKKIRVAVGPQVFAGLFQQRPAPAEGNIVKRDWIQYYGGPTGIQAPTDGRQIQSWDTNFGEETNNGSFVVGQVWSDKTGMFLLDQVRGRWGYVAIKKEFKKLADKWPNARAKYVEKKAAGAPLINDMKGKVKGIIPVNPRGSKEARLQAVAPYFESGDVWFPHPADCPWVRELVEELVSFPNADNDDQVDALTQALDRASNTANAGIKINLDVGAGAPAWRM